MNLAYSIPPVALLAAALAVGLLAAGGGQVYVHRRFRSQDFVQHNEVAGFIVAVVGALYAVLLGFFTVVIWQHFAQVRQLVVLESATAADTWHTAMGLPSPVRSRLRNDVLNYAEDMIKNEWPKMRRGEFDPKADHIIMDAMSVVGGLMPANMREGNAQAATMHQLITLHDERQRRIDSNYSGVSWFEWLVLLIGAACVVCFCWLFGVRNERVHILMTSIVVIMIVSTLVLLFELQCPFRSKIGIGPGAWKEAVEHMRSME